VDEDCVLTGVQCSSGNALVSADPAITVATYVTPTAVANRWDLMAFVGSGSAVAGILPQLKIPLEQGRTIFVANSSATATIHLFLDSPSAI